MGLCPYTRSSQKNSRTVQNAHRRVPESDSPRLISHAQIVNKILLETIFNPRKFFRSPEEKMYFIRFDSDIDSF